MQAVVAVLFVGFMSIKDVPFSECVARVYIVNGSSYESLGKGGQECIQ